MAPAPEILPPERTSAILEGTPFTHLAGRLYARLQAPDFRTATRFVAQIAKIAEEADHHPELGWNYQTVGVRLTTHERGGVTEKDLELAAKIAGRATELGLFAQRVAPSVFEVAIDAVDAEAIRGFWRAGLGYEDKLMPDGGIELSDPLGVGPTVWFQEMDPPRGERNRVHLDVYVPTADAPTRIAEIVEAGGRLVSDEHAPDWWVLADAEGNELCVSTSAV